MVLIKEKLYAKEYKKTFNRHKKTTWSIFWKKTLTDLSIFLSGYMCCTFERDGGTLEYLPGFQEFIEKRYNIKIARHWSEIICFFSSTEEDAFDQFYMLLDEYYNQSNNEN